jgi:predicted esterase
VRAGDAYKEAYSWYFRDPKSGLQMISPEFAAAALKDLVGKLGLLEIEWIILGFSQGGFFAPFLKRAGLNVRAIVAVGAGFRREAYEGLAPVRVRALHGAADEVVPLEHARTGFEAIREMGYGVDFKALEGVGHTLNDEGRELVRALIAEEGRRE